MLGDGCVKRLHRRNQLIVAGGRTHPSYRPVGPTWTARRAAASNRWYRIRSTASASGIRNRTTARRITSSSGGWGPNGPPRDIGVLIALTRANRNEIPRRPRTHTHAATAVRPNASLTSADLRAMPTWATNATNVARAPSAAADAPTTATGMTNGSGRRESMLLMIASPSTTKDPTATIPHRKLDTAAPFDRLSGGARSALSRAAMPNTPAPNNGPNRNKSMRAIRTGSGPA